jgi:hypothetical protein
MDGREYFAAQFTNLQAMLAATNPKFGEGWNYNRFRRKSPPQLPSLAAGQGRMSYRVADDDGSRFSFADWRAACVVNQRSTISTSTYLLA